MRLDLTAVLNAIADVVFSRRRAWLALFALVTAGLGYSAGGLRVDAAFNKMVPLEHPYMKVFTQYQQTFGGANRVIVALRQRQGDIFNPAFFQALKQVTDEVFFIPGVDRR